LVEDLDCFLHRQPILARRRPWLIAAVLTCSLAFDVVPILLGSLVGVCVGAGLALWVSTKHVDDDIDERQTPDERLR
jgi:hypothetical protein